MSDLPGEPENEEFDVGVSFYADDFALTVRWTTSATTDDETRVLAASEWFAETYGFDPGQHATSTAVNSIPG